MASMQRTNTQCVPSGAVARAARALRSNAFRAAPVRRMPAAPARAEAYTPPTVADAKANFSKAFAKPLPALYSTVIQELLVQQHLFRWNKSYQYNEVAALGLVSIFDQVLEGLPDAERTQVFDAYINALQEDPRRYRDSAARMEEWARSLDGPGGVMPAMDGGEGQQVLQRIADAVKSGNFLYTRFFAVGVFRLLELAGGKDPKALAALVAALSIPSERVNADLLAYKGVLSKLQGAKDMMKEFIEREKRKAAERVAAKEASTAVSDSTKPVEA